MAPTINICIADDHPLYLQGVVDYLANFNIKVVVRAKHGHELIEALHATSSIPEVCLMDVNMPVMNGYQTTVELKKKWPNLKVVALSVHDHKFNIIEMVRSGAVGYLFKDCDPIKIVEAIHSVVEHGFYYSEVLDEKMQGILYNGMNSYKKINGKELKFLELVCKDLRYNEIAEIMNVSPRTVDGYRDSLFAKLNLRSKAGLILFAVLTGIVDIQA